MKIIFEKSQCQMWSALNENCKIEWNQEQEDVVNFECKGY